MSKPTHGEFAYRYNTRDISDPTRFKEALSLFEGKRIKYKELTHQFYFKG